MHCNFFTCKEEDIDGVPNNRNLNKKELKEYEDDVEILKADHLMISENQKGISFDILFSKYLKHAKIITITDPYIRTFHQIRNLMEFVETIVKAKNKEDDIKLILITQHDPFKSDQQEDYFAQIKNNTVGYGIDFQWQFDEGGTSHARHIIVDTGWKISLDRGLDIFQRFEMNDAFNLNNRLQETRSCKCFEVTYLKI